MAKKQEAASKKGAKAQSTEEKPKRPGIGKMVIAMLREEKLTPEEILAEVKRQVPDAKTTMACIYWYANNQGISLADRRRNETAKDPKSAEKAKAKKTAKAQGDKEVPEVHPVEKAKAAKPERKSPKDIVRETIEKARQPRAAK